MYTIKEHQQKKQQQEIASPYQERISLGRELQHVSPILPQGGRLSDTSIKQNKMNCLDFKKNKLGELDTPNKLIKEFYKNPQALQNNAEDFYFEDEMDDYSSNKEIYASAKNNEIYEQNKMMMKKGMQGYNEFDLTAKQINSNKRNEREICKQQLTGRISESPIPSATSKADTVKWTFSNKDSQETQKKQSVINKEYTNTQGLITKSLKSHDSQNSTNNPKLIKGKALDFGHMNSKLESEILLINKNFKNDFLLLSEDSKTNLELKSIDHFNHTIRNTVLQKGLNKLRATKYIRILAENNHECHFCCSQKVFDSDLNCSQLEDQKTKQQVINENLEKKYLTSREYYNVKIVNDVIYNETTHIVSVFKDYLIFDDVSEFLKRYYFVHEAEQRLPKMFEFYEKYSKVFPNYVLLPENKYMFKNIERKQRLYEEKKRIIQEQQEKEQQKQDLGQSFEKHKNKHKDRFSSKQQLSSFISQLSNNRMFDTKFIDSVANIKPSGIIESMQSSKIYNSQYQDHMQNSSILVQKHLQENMENAKKNKKKKNIEDLDLDELISKFIAKDSEFNIQQSSILPNELSIQKQKQIYDYPANKSQRKNEKPQIKSNAQSQQDTRTKTTSCKNRNDNIHSPTSQLVTNEGKILNYNIYNNYNQFINNENYYISTEENKLQPPKNDNAQKQESLSRTQSKANLHSLNRQQIKIQPQTPLKQTTLQTVITPSSESQDKHAHVIIKNKKKDQSTKETSPLCMIPKKPIQTCANPSGASTLMTTTAAITSREQSKDKQKSIPTSNYQSVQGQLIQQKQNTKVPITQQKQLTHTSSQQSIITMHSSEQNVNNMIPQKQSHIRSVERLKQIEEEMEQDYSKYVNEFGFKQTAIAKAMNTYRDKQLQQQLPENQGNNMRSTSTSQTRVNKQSTNLANQNPINTVKNQESKPIRNVRAKTILIGQNTLNSLQRSQKLSPERNSIQNQGNGLMQNQQTTPIPQSISTSNYITVKAQPNISQKTVKLKIPISQKGGQYLSTNQTPKRIKLQKTKSTSNLQVMHKGTQENVLNNLKTQRGRLNEVGNNDEFNLNTQTHCSQIIPNNKANIYQMQNSQKQLNQFCDMHLSNDMRNNQGIMAQQTISGSCGGTYVSTSILNSPLNKQNIQRNQSKTKASSRNDNNSQHQSQKSINIQSRAASSLLQNSNNKNKSKEKKRLSAGSNLSKKNLLQPNSNNIQQQLIQFLIQCQNQDSDLSGIPLSKTIKNYIQQSKLNSCSMKDLQNIKQGTSTLLKDTQSISSKSKQGNQGALNQHQQKQQNPQTIKTSRIAQSGSNILMQTKSKCGKNTARCESKKRPNPQNIINYQMNEAPQSISALNQYSNIHGITSQDVSSRLGSIFTSIDQTQDRKRVMTNSKSTENFEMFKMAALRAAQESQCSSQPQTNFLSNLKQQENQVLMQKIKLVQAQNSALSARNNQFDNQQQYQYEHNNQSIKTPQTIMMAQNIQKSQSRRTSDKYIPSGQKN